LNWINASIYRELIVGEHIGLLLRLSPTSRRHGWDFPDAQLLCGENATMPGNDDTVLINQGRRRPVPFLNADHYLRNLRC